MREEDSSRQHKARLCSVRGLLGISKFFSPAELGFLQPWVPSFYQSSAVTQSSDSSIENSQTASCFSLMLHLLGPIFIQQELANAQIETAKTTI
jgi:hypothetical protein